MGSISDVEMEIRHFPPCGLSVLKTFDSASLRHYQVKALVAPPSDCFTAGHPRPAAAGWT
jgi:hypothetical protein